MLADPVLYGKLSVRKNGMKKTLMLLWAFLFCSMNMYQAFSAEIREQSYTKEEVKRMKNTNAVIQTKLGDITLKFFPGVAPNHVNNFIELAEKGFYNGTAFHRVIPGFMIQGGDPHSKDQDRARHGTGGPGYSLKAEFNNKPHNRGTLSMARSNHPDSAGSQFFICVADAPHLNGQYTAFGEVVSGMDIVDKIVSQPRDRNDNPVERIEVTVEVIQLKDN
jgi:peptidyl-prolyl cis-trans isomerase B (cyclophilin B)